MRKRNIAGAALCAVGLALLLWQVFRESPWQAGLAIGFALVVAGALTLERPEAPELTGPRAAGRWVFEAAVPMSPSLTPTLRELLEEDAVGLELREDPEHEEVVVRFTVTASGRDVAERIGRRRLERHGLILEASRAVRP